MNTQAMIRHRQWLNSRLSLFSCGLVICVSSLLSTTAHATDSVATATAESGLDTLQVCLIGSENVQLTVELALNADTRARGLMERKSLPTNAGMLFVYPNDGLRAFWMYKTLIPLDIAYIDKEGVINEILTMEPCRSIFPGRCRNYPATQVFRMALEVNAGHFEEWQVAAGDQVYQQDCKTPLRALLAHD